ncbi:MAG: Cof-type HAD-IIB family hydrolase [Rikenellaceae bacterium]
MNFDTIVLDLDGTLTNSKKELSKRNRDTLIELQRRGMCVVLASGRPTYGIMPLARELQLEQFGGYILSYNGGVILPCSTMEPLHSNLLPNELIEPLWRESKAAGAVILSYNGESIVCEDAEDRYVGVEAHLNRMEVREVDDFISALPPQVPKCLTVGDPEKIIALEAHLKDLYGERMSIYRSEPFFLELVPLGVDKAQSLKLLLTHLGSSPERMVAFGDGFNDLSMIELAGCGVAMSNAQDVVKQRANAVTLSNDEDGVAHYIEEHILPYL